MGAGNGVNNMRSPRDDESLRRAAQRRTWETPRRVFLVEGAVFVFGARSVKP